MFQVAKFLDDGGGPGDATYPQAKDYLLGPNIGFRDHGSGLRV